MSADHTRFRGVASIGESLLSDQLETNIYAFLNWAFLNASGYYNVEIPTSGAYGGDWHRLRPQQDPYHNDGQVWQGFRQDWVWETGVDPNVQPIRVSGVFTNGVFQPVTGVGTYAHHINYPQGKVVFDSPISTGTAVTAEYSFRQVHIHTADSPWWKEIQFSSWRADSDFLQTGSGAWAILAQNRVQLPAIVIEATANISRTGLELGSTVAITRQDVHLHVLAETPFDKKRLGDTLTAQWDKRLILFNKNAVMASGEFPLDENGSPVDTAKMYPELLQPNIYGGYGWRQLRISNTQSVDMTSRAPLYYSLVRWVCEVDL